MQDNLVIVESPAKAKTIEKFLGKDFKVMSSYGHIRDLKKKELSIDLDTFEPCYEIPEEKKPLVTELRRSASSSVMVLIDLSAGSWAKRGFSSSPAVPICTTGP